jgi:hypothetical protein
MLKIMDNFLYVVLILGIIVGCAGTKKEVVQEPPPQIRLVMDESFDPLTLNDDDLSFPSLSVKPSGEVESYTPLPVKLDSITVNELTDGYRIQIFSTKDLEKAVAIKQIAIDQLDSLGVKTYLDFDSPYYKIRIGDYLNQENAENSIGFIRSLGYPSAWIVPAKVWTNPE